MLNPEDFIHVAEECGLIEPIGQWVLLEACRQSRRWSDAGFGVIPVAVNVSAVEFLAKDFLSGVRAVLIATGVQPANLELELTESVLMQDAEAAVVTLHALKEMGVRLAIDDFGTGYSSLSALKHFPIVRLKIDQSFVRELPDGEDNRAIARAVISLGRQLNLKVIAEGVETEKQLNFLRDNDCHEIQGYHYSKPVTPRELEQLLREPFAWPAQGGV